MGTLLSRRRYMGKVNGNIGYIQDGLIAWYDGEWNEDIGVHNPSATKWVNLADKGNDITNIDSNFTWGDDYLLPPVTAAVGSIPEFSPVTIEAVLTFSGTNFIPVIAFSSNRDLWIAIRANNTVNFFSSGHYVPVQRSTKLALSAPGLVVNNQRTNPSAIYVNGVDSIVKSNGGNLAAWTRNTFNADFRYGAGTAYWYCIRLYNRALTEAEIMNNWNIDKQRFNL
jgi:hypothetical protein